MAANSKCGSTSASIRTRWPCFSISATQAASVVYPMKWLRNNFLFCYCETSCGAGQVAGPHLCAALPPSGEPHADKRTCAKGNACGKRIADGEWKRTDIIGNKHTEQHAADKSCHQSAHQRNDGIQPLHRMRECPQHY